MQGRPGIVITLVELNSVFVSSWLQGHCCAAAYMNAF